MTDEPEVIDPDFLPADEAPKAKRAPRAAKVEEVRLHPVLTNEEFLAAKADALSRVEKVRKLSAKKAVIAEETERLRREDGMTTGSADKDEIVNILIDLPEYTRCISINRFEYTHGSSYRVPRHVYDTLREQMARAWAHEDQINGKSLKDKMANAMRRAPNLIDGSTGVARFDA